MRHWKKRICKLQGIWDAEALGTEPLYIRDLGKSNQTSLLLADYLPTGTLKKVINPKRRGVIVATREEGSNLVTVKYVGSNDFLPEKTS